jgi:hypothetical protein
MNAQSVFIQLSLLKAVRWSEIFQGLPVINRGIGGDTTIGVLARLHQVTDAKPQAVFF